MTAPKTTAQRQREYIDRWRAAGYKLLRNFWVPEAHEDTIRAFAADEATIRLYAERLQRKRQK
jgi:hypothetical protein